MKKKSMHGRTTLPGLVLFLLCCLVLWLISKLIPQGELTTKNDTGYAVYQLLLDIGFRPDVARIITAQAAHETGNFTSSLFKSNKNLFGFKYVVAGYNIGELNGYSNYESIAQSVADFKRYYDSKEYSGLTDVTTYVTTLKQNKYFEASLSEYIAGVQYFYNLYFNNNG